MQTTLSIVTPAGGQAGVFDLKPCWIEEEKGDQAVHDAVVAFRASLRSGTASTKRRGEVSGGGKKPWKQKGSGRARAGSIRSPVWRGGGITFGPLPRGYAKNVNRSVRRLALKRTFTERVKEGAVVVLADDTFGLTDPKTKQLAQLLDTVAAGRDALMVVSDSASPAFRAGANMPNVLVLKAAAVNPYWLLLFHKVVFSKPALEQFLKRLATTEEVTA
ncbi:MAG: 50S ribosomal protein L4 [Lentisphaeria bacterium]